MAKIAAKTPVPVKFQEVDRFQPAYRVKANRDGDGKLRAVEPRNGHSKVIRSATGAEKAQVPSLPYVRAVDRDGNIINLVVGTNWDPVDGKDTNYHTKTVHEFKRGGGFLWDEVPAGMSPEEWARVREAKVKELRAGKKNRNAEEAGEIDPDEVKQARAEFGQVVKQRLAEEGDEADDEPTPAPKRKRKKK